MFGLSRTQLEKINKNCFYVKNFWNKCVVFQIFFSAEFLGPVNIVYAVATFGRLDKETVFDLNLDKKFSRKLKASFLNNAARASLCVSQNSLNCLSRLQRETLRSIRVTIVLN